MYLMKVVCVLIFFIPITYSMIHLTNFHDAYSQARVIYSNCSDTVLLPCEIEYENNSSSTNLIMWFRLYPGAYPQPLILGSRQLINDQRILLRGQNTERHLEISHVKKQDEGYYLCKSGNNIQYSYNLTVLTDKCIQIVPNQTYVTIDEPINLICQIYSTEYLDDKNINIEWMHNNNLLNNQTEFTSTFSSANGIIYQTLTKERANESDSGIYSCHHGGLLKATAQVIVNHYPGVNKSRRLISQHRAQNSSSKASFRTVFDCFFIVYQFILVSFVAIP